MRKVLANRFRSACFVSKLRAGIALFLIGIAEYSRTADIFSPVIILLFFLLTRRDADNKSFRGHRRGVFPGSQEVD